MTGWEHPRSPSVRSRSGGAVRARSSATSSPRRPSRRDDLLALFDDAAWDGPSPAGGGTLGAGVEALWYDAYLHADDIRAAVGRPTQVGPGVRASVSHLGDLLTEQGHAPLTLQFEGIEVFTVSGGSDRSLTGDAMEFVLVATGRSDPGALGLDDSVNVYR